MPSVDNNQWFEFSCAHCCRKLLFYNNLLSIFLMAPFLFISGEATSLMENKLFFEFRTWVNLTITGIFGFLINIAVFLQIKFTSPLTNNVTGTAKACVQTVVAILVYRNPVSLMVTILREIFLLHFRMQLELLWLSGDHFGILMSDIRK